MLNFFISTNLISICTNYYYYLNFHFNFEENITMPDTYYKERILKLREEKSLQKKKLSQIISARIVSFIILLVIISLSIHFQNFNILFITIIPIVAFGFLLKKHQKEKLKFSIIKRKIELNEQEIEALKNNFSEFENGKEFIDSEHPFSHDVDLFGEKSLFQYLNRTTSQNSKANFAQFISHFEIDSQEIITRQEACEEMKNKSSWRENFRAFGLLFQTKDEEIKELTSWKFDEINLFQNPVLWKILLWLIPIFSITITVLYILGFISTFFFLLGILIPLGIVGSKIKTVNEQHKKITQYLPILTQQSKLSKLIENENFTSKRLREIKNVLIDNNSSATKEINELAFITQQIDNRSNPVFALLMNALFLWDLQYMFQLKKWLTKNQHLLKNWFQAVYDIELYASLGTFKFNNPDFSVPIINNSDVIKAENLAHPLLSKEVRISSDICLNNLQEFMIITGANMAGKSTFLRAIATNLILASCGAPTCASKFSYTPIPLFTSMRTSDSLSDNESYFYSELKRLQVIVDTLKKGGKLFVILDEILKGTNSKDKAEGSKKFVKQLLNYESSGIIATHDLSLCSLKEEFPSNIQTHYFDVEISNDELVFDYKLKPGICSNMNAEFLMKKMGITE